MESYIGQIMTVGFNFAPQGWAQCQGQIMSVNQNAALFSLLGVNFGGNGSSTFGLPNLSGRVPVGTGPLQGGSTYQLGQVGGNENVTLTQQQMPTHTHAATFSATGSSLSAASQVQATTAGPVANAVLGRSVDLNSTGAKPAIYAPAGSAADTALAGLNVAGSVTLTSAGGSQPLSVLSPYLGLTMIICLQGIYPQRQ